MPAPDAATEELNAMKEAGGCGGGCCAGGSAAKDKTVAPAVPAAITLSEDVLKKKTQKELKELCRDRSLAVSGNKGVLVNRLLGREPMKVGKGQKLSARMDAVHARLTALGVKNVENVNECLKAAVLNGHISLDGDDALAKEVGTLNCIYCTDGRVTVIVRDCLFQSTYGGDYEDGSEGGAIPPCSNCKDDIFGMQYITGLCYGDPHLDCGKFHNHCTECKGFGECIGDYRMAHCDGCGEHYFCGGTGQPCHNCERKKKRKRGGPGGLSVEKMLMIGAYFSQNFEGKKRDALMKMVSDSIDNDDLPWFDD